MRSSALLFLLVAAGFSTPSAASEVIQLSINGTVSGSQNTIMCGWSGPAGCLATYPGGSAQELYSALFDVSLVTTPLHEGDNPFAWGNPYANGYWVGVINDSGGYLTGRDLTFSYQDPGVRTGTVGSRWITATASTFNVIGGIPEPTTWAMMLFGMAAISFQLRRQPKKTLALTKVA